MKFRRLLMLVLTLALAAAAAHAQDEATSGFELRTTVSGEALASPLLSSGGSNYSATGAFRAVIYPTWKINDHWTVFGAVQESSYPYFFQDLGSDKKGVTTQVLQAYVSYSQFWGDRSLVLRAGELSSAFGSFLLRYDDDVNPLVDMPLTYGYYLKGVTTDGITGGEADVTLGKVDVRAQLMNSSPINPRAPFQSDQYPNWVAGGGYTIRQGLRIGASAYRGPYLDHQFPYYFPGELPPAQLPATGVGADLEWGYGHWNVNAEWQRFQMDYHAIPTVVEEAGYAEARYVFNPRWYLATRIGVGRFNIVPGMQTYEAAVGFRPGAHELVKLDYEVQQGPMIHPGQQNVLALQFITNLRLLSFAGTSH